MARPSGKDTRFEILAGEGGLGLRLGDLRRVTIRAVRRHGQAKLVQLVARNDALARVLLPLEADDKVVMLARPDAVTKAERMFVKGKAWK